MTTQMSNVIPGGGPTTGAAVPVYQCAGAPVAAVNDVQTITVSACTHSTLTLSNLPGGLVYAAAQDVTPEALDDALSTLLGDAAAVEVTGTYAAGSGGTYIFTWGGTYAGMPIPVLGVSAVFVGGSTPTAVNVHTTPGVAATYDNVAPKGALLVDTVNTQLYINTGTQLVPVWAQIAHA